MTSAYGNVSCKSNPKKKRKNGDGSVYSISGRNKWGAAITNVHGDRVSKTFETTEAAWAWLAEEIRAKNQGLSTVAANPNQTLSDFLVDWVDRNESQKKPSTSRNYRSRIKNQIIPAIGNLRLAHVSPRILEDLILNLVEKGFSAGTVKGVYRTLSAAFSDGFRLGDIPTNPMKRVKMPRLKSVPLKHIPDVDAAIIYSHASQNPYLHARIELGMVCGLRPGEVLGLLWSDVDWELRILHIRRQVQEVKGCGLVFQTVKQNQDRVIYLSDLQVSILKSHKELQDSIRDGFEEDEDLIFPNRTGRKLDHRRDDRIWKNLLKKSGVPSYSRYQMRKTAFTKLYAEIKDMRKLMEYSGHSQVSTLINSYVFASDDYKDEIRKSVDAIRPSNSRK